VNTFSLKGKIITKEIKPAEGFYVLAYDKDNILNPDDLLGESLTDSNGFFGIDFDRSKFAGFLEPLEGSPDVYLKISEGRGGKEILTTEEMRTNKEMEYHIKVADHIPDPGAPDIYAGNARRLLGMLDEVANMIGLERQINIDLLTNEDLPQEIKKRLENFAEGDEERRRNFDHLLVIFSSLIDSYLEEMKIGTIGYDGPQVPRQPRRERYNQVIMWPRGEAFKWA
jgi:cold shock CspA family protein